MGNEVKVSADHGLRLRSDRKVGGCSDAWMPCRLQAVQTTVDPIAAYRLRLLCLHGCFTLSVPSASMQPSSLPNRERCPIRVHCLARHLMTHAALLISSGIRQYLGEILPRRHSGKAMQCYRFSDTVLNSFVCEAESFPTLLSWMPGAEFVSFGQHANLIVVPHVQSPRAFFVNGTRVKLSQLSHCSLGNIGIDDAHYTSAARAEQRQPMMLMY